MSDVLGSLQSGLAGAERLAGRLSQAGGTLGAAFWPGVALALGVGIALLVAGSRLPRLIAALGGAAIGWLAGTYLAPALATGRTSAAVVTAGFAATLALASALAPPLYAVIVGALPGALLGVQLPFGGNPAFGAASGALVLGLAAFGLRRIVVAVTAASIGAALLAVATLALSPRIAALQFATRRPILLIGAAALLAVTGAAFQLGARHRYGARGGPLGGGREPLRG